MRNKLENNTMIAIPSRDRASWLLAQKHHTLLYVKHLNPILLVRDDDPQLATYKIYADMFNAKLILSTSRSDFGVAKAYDTLIDYAIAQGYKRLILLDDDMYFQMWNPIIGATPVLLKISDAILTELFSQWADLVTFQMPAISPLSIDRRSQNTLIKFASPLAGCYALYLPHFEKYKEHRFHVGYEIEARCDFNLSLNILTTGFLTAYFSPIIFPNLMHYPGGCSIYRTLECESASINYLKDRYPKFVTGRLKQGWMNDPTIVREAPRVKWKKAFNSELFHSNFKLDARTFMHETLKRYEKIYSNFIEELRQ